MHPEFNLKFHACNVVEDMSQNEMRLGAVIRNGAGLLRMRVGNELVVAVESDDDSEMVRLPYPSAGYGGHEIVVSPDERYAAVFIYSGQSEIGYELFELKPSLRHRASVPYVFGTGDAPVFSADGKHIAMAYAVNEYLDPVDFIQDPDDKWRFLVRWAEIHFRSIESGDVAVCSVNVLPSPREQNEGQYPTIRFKSNTELELSVPWLGALEVPIPLQDSVTIAGPT